LISIFLITKDTEHFFKCFSVMRDSSVENSLFSSVPHFLNWVIYLCICYLFLVSNFLSSSCILDIALCRVNDDPFPICRLCVCTTDSFFGLTEAFQFMGSHISIIDGFTYRGMGASQCMPSTLCWREESPGSGVSDGCGLPCGAGN